MIVADTGPLVALMNTEDNHHARCSDFFHQTTEEIVVPAPVLTEVCYMISRLPQGYRAEQVFLRSLATGEMHLEPTSSEDLQRMADLVGQYSDFPLGTVDAAVVTVAERLGTPHIATLDIRHFRTIKPAHCAAFELLPG